jgi:DNA-binding NtrC family response regulator
MLRVLVVDDDLAILEMVSTALRQADMRPVLASSGDAARTAFADDGPFDAVLIDRSLRKEDGRQLADDLVRHGQPETRVLLMSGYHDDATAYVSVPKPFRLDTLVSALRNAGAGA